MNKILLLYNYFEKNECYKKNFELFLKYGVTDSVDHIISINGPCSVKTPRRNNIAYYQRENVGYDFGAYDDIINRSPHIDNYDYFIFLNCVVRGPFLPGYCKFSWTEAFLEMLSDDVKLAGTTINILHPEWNLSALFKSMYGSNGPFARYGFREPYAHVQTTLFVLDRACLTFLRQANFFNRGHGNSKMESILGCEVLLSQLVLANGWNISCLLPDYRNIDYRTIERDINPTSELGNPWYQNGYFGRTLHPYDTIFFNTNTGIADFDLMDRLEETMTRRLTGSL